MKKSAEAAKQGKKKRKKAPVLIAVVLILFIVVWRLVSCSASGKAGAYVQTTQAIIGDLQESISTSGSVASEEEKIYFAPVAGTLGSIKVTAGDSVKKGDILISYNEEQAEKTFQQATLQQTISDSTYQGTLSENSKNQAKLREANTNLSVLDQQIKDNEAYLEQLQDALSKNQRETSVGLSDESYNLGVRAASLQQEMAALDPTSPEYAEKAKQLQEVNAAQSRNSYLQQIAASNSSDYVVNMEKEIANVNKKLTEYREYKAEMESQKASSQNTILDSYQKEKYQADSEIAFMTFKQAEEDYYTAKKGITAEFDGIIMECSAVEGAMVTNGMQLLTLADSNQIKVVFSASKYDLEKLELGQNAEVTISGNIYKGTICKINRMAQINASNTPMVGVEIHLTNPDDKIILGLDAKIVVYTNKAEQALLVPVEAINADRDGDFLYVVENGIVVRKSVICGISSDTYTEIKEGITQEDKIILTSFSNLEEGMEVVEFSTGTGMSEQTEFQESRNSAISSSNGIVAIG